MFKISDHVMKKNNGTIVWKITGYMPALDEFRLEVNYGSAGIISLQESNKNLMNYYKLTDEKGNDIVNKESSSEQLLFEGFYGMLEKYKECNHEWKVYHGLNFSDEFCEKCKKVRDIK